MLLLAGISNHVKSSAVDLSSHVSAERVDDRGPSIEI
jgi:hypothetical protein